MKLDILGTKYKIKIVTPDHPDLEEESDGLCNFWTKTILVKDLSDWPKKERKKYYKQILRHETLHAFLFESGLAYNSCESDSWSMNEEMIDWFAIQSPKLFQLWEEAGCL